MYTQRDTLHIAPEGIPFAPYLYYSITQSIRVFVSMIICQIPGHAFFWVISAQRGSRYQLNSCSGLIQGCFTGEKAKPTFVPNLANGQLQFASFFTAVASYQVPYRCNRGNNNHDRQYIKSLVDFKTDQWKKDHIDVFNSHFSTFLSLA